MEDKTIEEWLKLLPSKFRNDALEEFNRPDNCYSPITQRESSLDNALIHAFDWYEAMNRTGIDWNRIYKDIQSGKITPVDTVISFKIFN